MKDAEQPVSEVESCRLAELDEGLGRVHTKRAGEPETDKDGRNGGEISGDGAPDADIHEGVTVGNAPANENDGPGCSAEGGRGEEKGKGSRDAMDAAGDVVAEFMGEQDGQESDGEGPAGEEFVRVMEEPRPRPEIAVFGKCRQAEAEVLHEPGTDGESGENADGEQEEGQANANGTPGLLDWGWLCRHRGYGGVVDSVGGVGQERWSSARIDGFGNQGQATFPR